MLNMVITFIKHMRLYLKFIGVAFILFSLFQCKKDPPIVNPTPDSEILAKYLNLPPNPYNYISPALPDFFNSSFISLQNNTPANNTPSDWGATLGRVLFYDTRLSKNRGISCSSCHQQQFGFTDTAQFSLGFLGGKTKRHSMSLINATYYLNGRFFWDERAASLEEQVLQPIQDEVEMGMLLDSLVLRLQKTEFYPILFKNAFGNTEITSARISKALAQFVRSMVSYQAPYDLGLKITGNRNKDFSNFTAEENAGKNIFMNNLSVNCFGCHNTDVFIMDNPRNNGLKLTNGDPGIYTHTQNQSDLGKMKAPTLKNVAMRKRFMHDGSLTSLEEVVNHYNLSIQPNPNLDNHLKDLNGNPARMNLSASEIKALLAFLATLSDTEIIKDQKFSSPFK